MKNKNLSELIIASNSVDFVFQSISLKILVPALGTVAQTVVTLGGGSSLFNLHSYRNLSNNKYETIR